MADNGRARRRAGRRGLWIVAGIAAAGAVCAVVGIWHLPARMYPPGADGGAEARAALQGGLLTAAAALTAVAGGLIALDETRQANTEVRRANENTHVRELYATAISQLGDTSLDVRLGGIYALERVARDSTADQRTVVEVLSAFARVHSTDPALRPNAPDSANPIRPAVDVHAAVTVLARLPILNGVPRADLVGADFTGPATLHRLQAPGGILAGVSFGEADLTAANLVGANLVGVDLTGGYLTEADLGGAFLTGARLGAANLRGTNLRDAKLRSINLRDAHLRDADLRNTDLTDAHLLGANLARVKLRDADLTDACLMLADLTEADLTGADLTGADLTNAVGLTQEQVDVAWGNSRTLLPAGLISPASWVSGV